ncbi:MAG: hypothetical protein COB15_11105 [Flavobacteriales bacterium]|nr:MAG: hypothetical protein COB15_11105 [Flavobacteriales bacterium]
MIDLKHSKLDTDKKELLIEILENTHQVITRIIGKEITKFREKKTDAGWTVQLKQKGLSDHWFSYGVLYNDFDNFQLWLNLGAIKPKADFDNIKEELINYAADYNRVEIDSKKNHFFSKYIMDIINFSNIKEYENDLKHTGERIIRRLKNELEYLENLNYLGVKKFDTKFDTIAEYPYFKEQELKTESDENTKKENKTNQFEKFKFPIVRCYFINTCKNEESECGACYGDGVDIDDELSGDSDFGKCKKCGGSGTLFREGKYEVKTEVIKDDLEVGVELSELILKLAPVLSLGEETIEEINKIILVPLYVAARIAGLFVTPNDHERIESYKDIDKNNRFDTVYSNLHFKSIKGCELLVSELILLGILEKGTKRRSINDENKYFQLTKKGIEKWRELKSE